MTTAEMKKIEKSPAVKSLRKEQAQQARQRTSKGQEDDLDRGLKDSFPASDPVSVTNTTTSGEPDEVPKKPVSPKE